MTLSPRAKAVRTVSASAVAVVASLAFPFLIHLLPAGEGVQLGSTLLPIFWAPLLAAFVFGSVPAVAAAALAPLVNNAVTGLPPDPALLSITLELLVFVGLVLALLPRVPRIPLLAPAAYAVAKLAVTMGTWAMTGVPDAAGASLAASFQTALPGIAVLMLLNIVALSVGARPPRD